MSEYREGCQLSVYEIVAILSLAGKQAVVGLSEQEVSAITSEKMWDACCSLMRDEMLSQKDGRFQPSKKLMEVMQPLCQANVVLVLTPESDLYAQVIFYCSETVCAMTRASYGGYILRAMDVPEVSAYLAEGLQLVFPDIAAETEEMPLTTIEPQDSRTVLLKGARFVIEQFHPDTGKRLGWLRLVEHGLTSWLQWVQKDCVMCEELSVEGLDSLIRALQRGEL